MVILLDIDGVLVPELQADVKILPDGFKEFDAMAVKNLVKLITATSASIILTTNHRISFSCEKWVELFEARGVNINSISKINEIVSVYKMMDRGTEIKEWVDNFGFNTNYVIVDDDYAINTLPAHIKNRWVMTDPAIGLDDEAANKALNILLSNTH